METRGRNTGDLSLVMASTIELSDTINQPQKRSKREAGASPPWRQSWAYIQPSECTLHPSKISSSAVLENKTARRSHPPTNQHPSACQKSNEHAFCFKLRKAVVSDLRARYCTILSILLSCLLYKRGLYRDGMAWVGYWQKFRTRGGVHCSFTIGGVLL